MKKRGIDVSELMPYGTKKEVGRGVIHAIKDTDCSSDYSLGSTTDLDNRVPARNIITMIETTHKYGRYPLQGNLNV